MDGLSKVVEGTGVDGLLLYANSLRSIDRPSAFEHFTGTTPIANNNCVIYRRDAEPILLVDLERDVDRLIRHTGIDDVRPTETFDASLAGILDEADLTGTVGIVGRDRIPISTYGVIEEATDAVEVLDDEADAEATSKSDADLRTFEELGRIADAGFQAAFEALQPGIKEYELAAEIEHEMYRQGSEDNFNLISAGTHNRLMSTPTESVIQEGDTVLFEISPMIDGNVVQVCRTISFGTPNRTLVEKYDLLEEALREAKERIQPGEPVSVIASAMNEILRDAGYAEYCKPPYMRTRGHEFGIGPVGMAIDEQRETPIEEGQILVIHPNQYLPETGYLACGDPLKITADGFEELSMDKSRLYTKEVL